MSDARWLDVEDDVGAATAHFRNACALYRNRAPHGDSLSEYRDAMALMHALQSAHTSAESALLRVLRILGEDPPSGEDWHQKLIARAAKPIAENHRRPAILSPEVAADLDESRRFRNRATRSYGTFDLGKTGPTLEAASRLQDGFARDLALFRRTIDPEPEPG